MDSRLRGNDGERAGTRRDVLRYLHRSVRRVRVHAPGAGGRAGAGARRRPHRRVPDAAAHVARGRRHGACHPAGRRGRVPAVGTEPVRHDRGRLDRRLRRRVADRIGRAHDRAQGGRGARHVLSAVARDRRHHHLAQGNQYRSSARAVRQCARPRRPDPGVDRRHLDRHAGRARPDLPAARHRMRRSRLHALGQPGRRTGALCVPRPRGSQSGQRIPCARAPCSPSAS